MVRVASINPAGLSDWSMVQEFQTFPIKPATSSGGVLWRRQLLSVVVVVLTTFVSIISQQKLLPLH